MMVCSIANISGILFDLKMEPAGFAGEFYKECQVRRRIKDNLVYLAWATRQTVR